MVREVQISWRGGGWGGEAQPPPCSKNKEFVLTLHGNLRCLRQEPLRTEEKTNENMFFVLHLFYPSASQSLLLTKPPENLL